MRTVVPVIFSGCNPVIGAALYPLSAPRSLFLCCACAIVDVCIFRFSLGGGGLIIVIAKCHASECVIIACIGVPLALICIVLSAVACYSKENANTARKRTPPNGGAAKNAQHAESGAFVGAAAAPNNAATARLDAFLNGNEEA